MFKGQLVECTSAISTGNTITVGTNVAATDVGSILSQLNSNLAPIYSAQKTYAVGDLCTHSGKLYKCIIAVTTPEAFNINKWNDVTTSEVYAPALNPVASITCNGSTTTFGIAVTTLLSNLDISILKPNAFIIDAADQGRAYNVFNLLNYRDSGYVNFYHIELLSTNIVYKLYGYEYGISTPTAAEIIIKIDGTAGSRTDIKDNIPGINRVLTLYN